MGREERGVVLEVCSAFKEEPDVVCEEDVVESASGRGCPSGFRVPPAGDEFLVAFKIDTSASVPSWSVTPCDEDACLVDDIERGGEGVSL